MKNIVLFSLVVISLLTFSCKPKTDPQNEVNKVAEEYVKLCLHAGLHDPIFVDAYYGPEEWKLTEGQKKPIQDLIHHSQELITYVSLIDKTSLDETWKLRHNYLHKQLIAVKTRLELLNGKKMTFDEQTKGLFDAVAPSFTKEYFDKLLRELESVIPGNGDLNKRLNDFRNQFVIPEDKLDTVFTAAINECRKRTLQHVDLPEHENFEVEYVKDEPWGAYNWYKGNFFSLIQVNTDLPLKIDRAIDLACHEGYPGHHVYNGLLEKTMYVENKWVEFSVYALFSPQSLIAEGSANYGIPVTFPGEERIQFEKEVLFPLAGLDASKADQYYEIEELLVKLSFAGNEAGKKYINGEFTREQYIEWRQKYTLVTKERAEQNSRFLETYGTYIINYNYGKKLVKEYVESKAGNDPEKIWEVYVDLLSKPYTASLLQ